MKILTILAAGQGSRMGKLTKKTPKPLIKINGKRMIESIIENLNNFNWDRINVVVGYRFQEFEYLKEKYGVNLVRNDYYEITSTYYSYMKSFIDYPGGHFIVNADLVLSKIGESIPNKTTVYSFLNKSPDNWTVEINNDRVTKIYTDQKTENQIVEAYFIEKEHGEILQKRFYSEGPTKRNLFLTLSSLSDELFINSSSDFKGHDIDNIVDLNKLDPSYEINEENIEGFIKTFLVNNFNLIETHNVQINNIEKINKNIYSVNFKNLINNSERKVEINLNDY
ncbi:MAG: NTP transferase domain-containing protein [Mycoplasmatales bacterium]|nr:NTP transferase domain-containing protein [Mycoplasmatales bacterium]